jgi:polysaccharide pyruvyl transferase WcaK-like protein
VIHPSGRLRRILCNGRFYRAVCEADLIVSTGGHHLTTLLTRDGVSSQICDQAMAILSGKPLVLWSQSIGPFEFHDPRDLELAKAILTRSAMIFTRDEQSLELMRRHDISQANVRETFDSVVGLNDAMGDYVVPSARENIVGAAIYSAQQRSPGHHRNYVESMVSLVSQANVTGAVVRFFPMELKGSISDDRPLIREIVSRCAQAGGRCVVEDRDLDCLTHLKEVAKCRLFVGHKTHSVVFGLTVGTPMLAIAYHRKTRDFMDRYGLSENCIDDNDLTTESLLRTLANLQANLDAVGAKQVQASRVLGAKVRQDFGAMLASFSGSGADKTG